MKIGIDASRAFGQNRTGTEEYSYQLINHLNALPEAKKHIWILYVRPNFKFKNYNLNSNFKFQIINLQFLWTQIGLASRTWIDNLDVLWVPAHTLPILRKPGLRTVVTIHGIEYEWLPAYENFLQRWYLPLSTKYAVHSASKVIAVSHFTSDQLISRLHATPNKIEVIHEGVEPNLQLPILNFQATLKKFDLQKNKYLLFIGTIQPRKNLERLIEAFSKLTQPDLKLVIAGKNGWSYQSILNAPDKCGISGKVVFTGYTNEAEKNTLLQNALVYVQPSITEGFGLPVLEAFAAAVPVVSSDGGALKEVAQIKLPTGGSNLFDPYNINRITEVLQLAITSKSWREALIKQGTTKLKHFTWQNSAQKTYNILISNLKK
jgi:glycosyltransferase involved in cell wall biosynthesis